MRPTCYCCGQPEGWLTYLETETICSPCLIQLALAEYEQNPIPTRVREMMEGALNNDNAIKKYSGRS